MANVEFWSWLYAFLPDYNNLFRPLCGCIIMNFLPVIGWHENLANTVGKTWFWLSLIYHGKIVDPSLPIDYLDTRENVRRGGEKKKKWLNKSFIYLQLGMYLFQEVKNRNGRTSTGRAQVLPVTVWTSG